MGRKQMATAVKIVTWVFSGASFTATVAAIFFLGGAWKEFEGLKETVETHCAEQKVALQEMESKREKLSEKVEADRKIYSNQQSERDKEQDRVYEMFGANLSDVNGRVQAMQGKLDSVGGDVAIIKQLLMKRPGP
jgi:hypothetical protein